MYHNILMFGKCKSVALWQCGMHMHTKLPNFLPIWSLNYDVDYQATILKFSGYAISKLVTYLFYTLFFNLWGFGLPLFWCWLWLSCLGSSGLLGRLCLLLLPLGWGAGLTFSCSPPSLARCLGRFSHLLSFSSSETSIGELHIIGLVHVDRKWQATGIVK